MKVAPAKAICQKTVKCLPGIQKTSKVVLIVYIVASYITIYIVPVEMYIIVACIMNCSQI